MNVEKISVETSPGMPIFNDAIEECEGVKTVLFYRAAEEDNMNDPHKDERMAITQDLADGNFDILADHDDCDDCGQKSDSNEHGYPELESEYYPSTVRS